MSLLRRTRDSLIEFLNASPWLFFSLIPIFYHILPTTSPQNLLVVRGFNYLLPIEVQAEVVKYEPTAYKLSCSCLLALMTGLVVNRAGQDIELSVED